MFIRDVCISRKKIMNNQKIKSKNFSEDYDKSSFTLFPKKDIYKIILLLLGLVGFAFLIMLIIFDSFPSDLTVILAIVPVVLFIAISMLLGQDSKWKRLAGLLFSIIFLFVFSFTTYYMYNTYSTINAISTGEWQSTGPHAKKVSITEEPFNLYITGIDQWEEDEGLDLERSDVNMIVTVNPITKKVLLTSIPRDSYVKLHTSQQMDKLTHSGIYGVDETLSTVEDWLNIDINYYIKMNFTATEDLIDAMGGIDVYSPVAFESSLQGNKYVQGWNHLDGWDALYFARERKSFEGKDEIRVENQQRVMKAIIKKLTSSKTLLVNYGDIMQAAGKNLSTNVSSDEVLEMIKMQVTDLSEWNVEAQKITGTDGMDYVASLTQSQRFSVYYPDDDAVDNAKLGIDAVMNPSDLELEEAERNRGNSFFISLIRSALHKDQKD